jgi:hypothetical protein
MSQSAAPANLNICVFTQSGPKSDIYRQQDVRGRNAPSDEISARVPILVSLCLFDRYLEK